MQEGERVISRAAQFNKVTKRGNNTVSSSNILAQSPNKTVL